MDLVFEATFYQSLPNVSIQTTSFNFEKRMPVIPKIFPPPPPPKTQKRVGRFSLSNPTCCFCPTWNQKTETKNNYILYIYIINYILYIICYILYIIYIHIIYYILYIKLLYIIYRNTYNVCIYMHVYYTYGSQHLGWNFHPPLCVSDYPITHIFTNKTKPPSSPSHRYWRHLNGWKRGGKRRGIENQQKTMWRCQVCQIFWPKCEFCFTFCFFYFESHKIKVEGFNHS